MELDDLCWQASALLFLHQVELPIRTAMVWVLEGGIANSFKPGWWMGLITVERETVNVRSKPKEEPSAKKSLIWSYKRDESGGTLVNPRPGQESFETDFKSNSNSYYINTY